MRDILQRAKEQLEAFPNNKSVDVLGGAEQSLESIKLTEEEPGAKRLSLRKELIETWLQLARTVEQNLDPNFDPRDVPVLSVAPADGYTGMPPEKIKDPQARLQYEKAIAENRVKTAQYTFQTKLRRLDERLMQHLEEFVRASYTAEPSDRKDLEWTLDKSGIAATRKQLLLAKITRAK